MNDDDDDDDVEEEGPKKKKQKFGLKNNVKYKGVEKKKGNRFQAYIQIHKKKRGLGTFGTAKEAAIAFDLAAIQSKRSTSHLNFPNNMKKEISKRKHKKKQTCSSTGKMRIIRVSTYFDGRAATREQPRDVQQQVKSVK